MKTTLTLLITLLICTLKVDPGYCQDVKRDYPLPETILILDVTAEGPTNFGNRFCWVGDQNGDGFDDLLVSHDPYLPRPPHSNKNQVELYYGGSPMSTQPGFVFHIEGDSNGIGSTLSYLGRLMSGSIQMIGISSYHITKRSDEDTVRLSIYNGGSLLDETPEYTLTRDEPHQVCFSRQAHRMRPFDFNRDGFDDLVTTEDLGSDGSYNANGRVKIYYGGSEFDTLADWSVWLRTGNGAIVTVFSTGYDVNTDGYDDLLVRYEKFDGGSRSLTTISLFLGGSPPDTIPVCTWDTRTYTKPYCTELKGFSLVPDINGDGYDDWAIAYSVDGTNDGTFVYFGGEHPDSLWDVNLPRHGGIIMKSEPDVTGGDFNGDGYGDIVTSNNGAYYREGEVRLYFGHPGWAQTESDDISINGVQKYGENFQYFGQYVGAVGDYNGDGVDDFVVRVCSTDGYINPKLIVLGGNRGWKVNVDSEPVPTKQELSLSSYPNPVNNEATVSYSILRSEEITLEVLDVRGRQIGKLVQGFVAAGEHQTAWSAANVPAGLYFVRIQADNSSFAIIKVIVIK